MTRLSLALTGDTIMQRHVSTCEDPAFLGAVDVVRSATAGFTNLEGCIQAGEDWHAFLAGNGVGRGSRVALSAGNSPEFVAILFATMRLGGAIVMVSTAWRDREVSRS